MIALAVFLGLYFGMRNDPTPPAVAPTGAVPPAGAAAPSGQASAIPLSELVARAQSDAAQALEALHHDFLTACAPPPGSRIEIINSLVFDKDGQDIAWGMSPKDPAGVPVEQCIRKNFHTFRIPAPGRTVSVKVPLVLP